MPILIYGFDEGKNKNEVYSKDDVYTKTEVDDNVSTLQGNIDLKQDKHSAIAVTLPSSGWSNKTITVTAEGVTADNTVIVSPDPASFLVYGASGVYCSAQAENSLTFTCNNVPSSNLTVNVVILGV